METTEKSTARERNRQRKFAAKQLLVFGVIMFVILPFFGTSILYISLLTGFILLFLVAAYKELNGDHFLRFMILFIILIFGGIYCNSSSHRDRENSIIGSK
ncbi:MAG TPA: hypothetical protein VI112_15145 [Bacteroidia bacterium]|jgi:Na+/H+ antiporter NhaD/arsenite permease-like protein